jgi:hypothetical protein
MHHRLGRWAAWVIGLVAGCRTEVVDFSSDTAGAAGAGGVVEPGRGSGGSSGRETGGRDGGKAGSDERGVPATGGSAGSAPEASGGEATGGSATGGRDSACNDANPCGGDVVDSGRAGASGRSSGGTAARAGAPSGGSDGVAGAPSGGTPSAGGGASGGSLGTGGTPSGGSVGTGGTPSCKFVGSCTEEYTDLLYDANSRQYTYLYDDAERLVSMSIDTNADGTAEDVTRYGYDADGNLLEVRDDGCDTPSWGCRWIIYTYDEQGRTLSVDDHSQYSGRVATCDRYVYDERGNVARIESGPPGCEGPIEQIRSFEYDEDGRKVEASYGDPPRTLYHYSYDEAGRLAKEEVDSFADGSVDETVEYTYDDHGNLLKEAHEFAEGSLVSDYYAVWTYDDAGNQLTEKYVYPSSTPPDALCRTWTYDDCGNRLTEESSSACAETADARSRYSYDCFE